MKRIWSSGNGLIELSISQKDYKSIPASGQADSAIAELMTKKHILAEFALIPDSLLTEELSGCGAWSAEELQDRKTNIERLLWIACLDMQEGRF